MTNARGNRAVREAPEATYFQGKIGSEDFKANYVNHTLKNGYWLLEGTQREESRIGLHRHGSCQGAPGILNAARTVVVFKYLDNQEVLPSGRYTLIAGQVDCRLTAIIMDLDETGVPAYTVEHGTIEFFHNIITNVVTGAIDANYRDVNGFEVHVQLLFSS